MERSGNTGIPDYDYVFAGLGLAGMSLLLEMSGYPGFGEKRILAIDRSAKTDNDRTWSFWAKGVGALKPLVVKSWRRGEVIDAEEEVVDLRMGEYGYYTIQGGDFYRYFWEKMRDWGNVEFVQDEIVGVSEDGAVECREGMYGGKLVFNSWFLRKDWEVGKEESFLWQHFKGYFLEVAEERFDPERVTLMDYRGCSPDRMNFFYILPFSGRRALVEFTEFSREFYRQEEYDRKIEEYLQKYWQITEFEIRETEFNAIPMTDRAFGPLIRGRVVTIGTKGGFVKPSSGYAFTRIRERSALLAERLMTGRGIRERDLHSSWRYRFYDRIMLSLLADGKTTGSTLFPMMFRKAGAERVFRFLDERPDWYNDLLIISSVPEKWKYMLRLFRCL